MNTAVQLELPEFLLRASRAGTCLTDREGRVRHVLELVKENIATGGGPFAAAVFDMANGRLIAAGANRVVSTHCSSAHAEILALSYAQQTLACYDLGADPGVAYELVSSAEPCAMCFGALLWSGVRSLVYAAQSEDVLAIGFDEGAKHPDWIGELQRRGISVAGGVLRAEACRLLGDYATAGGMIYNACRR